MKASELVAELQRLIAEHGDRPVRSYGRMAWGEDSYGDIKRVSVDDWGPGGLIFDVSTDDG